MTPPVLRISGPVLRGDRLLPGVLTITGGRVVRGGGGPRVELPRGWALAPGLVDVQVNGYAGHEVGDDPEGHAAIARALARDGVTGFCPTLVTRDDGGYRAAAAAMAATRWPAGGARNLGVHLEGPFLAAGRAGAHRADLLTDALPDRVRTLATLVDPRVVTLAPEVPGALDAVGFLAARGAVVSLGHTDAGAGAVRRAIDAGARMLTHALNAMPGITARGPDGPAAALVDPRVAVGVVADGVHVARAALAVLHAVAGSRLVLVSDAVAAAGAPPGRFRLSGRDVVSDGAAVRAPDGTLAGSAAPLWRGVETLMAAGVDRGRALAAACVAPRRLLGLPGLAPGDPADLVVVDGSGRPRWTAVGGVPVDGELADVVSAWR